MLTGGFGPQLFNRTTTDNIIVGLEMVLEFQVYVLVILSMSEDIEGMLIKVSK